MAILSRNLCGSIFDHLCKGNLAWDFSNSCIGTGSIVFSAENKCELCRVKRNGLSVAISHIYCTLGHGITRGVLQFEGNGTIFCIIIMIDNLLRSSKGQFAI